MQAVNDELQCRTRTPQNLPNPRRVSSSFHSEDRAVSPDLTNMVPQMGQFLDHDITLTPEIKLEHCCSRDAGRRGRDAFQFRYCMLKV